MANTQPANSKLLEMMKIRKYTSIGGGILGIISLGLLIVALVRHEWLDYRVNLGNAVSITPQSNVMYYSRYRGLFYECINTTSAQILSSPIYQPTVEHGSCFKVDLGQLFPNVENDDYRRIINIRRSQIGLIVVGMLSLLIGTAIVFSSGLCALEFTNILFVIASGSFLLSVLSIITSQFIFHALLTAELLTKSSYFPTLYRNWPIVVQDATTISYSHMYVMVWFAALIACFATIGVTIALLINNKFRISRPTRQSLTNQDNFDSVPVYPNENGGGNMPMQNMSSMQNPGLQNTGLMQRQNSYRYGHPGGEFNRGYLPRERMYM